MRSRWMAAAGLILLAFALSVTAGEPAPLLRIPFLERQSHREFHPEEGCIFYGSYPRSINELLARNPETVAFALNYPSPPEEAVSLAGIPRDTVPLFLQWDTRWGYAEYGSDVLGITGCGPTCLAMIGYYLTGDEGLTPAWVARFSEEKGHYASGRGSKWSLFTEGAVQLGLTVAEVPLTEQAMTAALKSGHPLVLSMGPGAFTVGGHYIVAAGVEPGGFRIHDPNSRIRSRKLWRFDEIESQIRNVWEFDYQG